MNEEALRLWQTWDEYGPGENVQARDAEAAARAASYHNVCVPAERERMSEQRSAQRASKAEDALSLWEDGRGIEIRRSAPYGTTEVELVHDNGDGTWEPSGLWTVAEETGRRVVINPGARLIEIADKDCWAVRVGELTPLHANGPDGPVTVGLKVLDPAEAIEVEPKWPIVIEVGAEEIVESASARDKALKRAMQDARTLLLWEDGQAIEIRRSAPHGTTEVEIVHRTQGGVWIPTGLWTIAEHTGRRVVINPLGCGIEVAGSGGREIPTRGLKTLHTTGPDGPVAIGLKVIDPSGALDTAFVEPAVTGRRRTPREDIEYLDPDGWYLSRNMRVNWNQIGDEARYTVRIHPHTVQRAPGHHHTIDWGRVEHETDLSIYTSNRTTQVLIEDLQSITIVDDELVLRSDALYRLWGQRVERQTRRALCGTQCEARTVTGDTAHIAKALRTHGFKPMVIGAVTLIPAP